MKVHATNEPPVENPPLPFPLLPPREEREKNIWGVVTQGGTHCARLPWAIIFRPSGAGAYQIFGCNFRTPFGPSDFRHYFVILKP